MVRITKESIFFEFVEELPDGSEAVRSMDVYEIGSGLVSYLTQEVSIEEDVTVEDLFKHIEKDKANINYAMDSSLQGHQLQIFLDEIKEIGIIEPGMTTMEIAHQLDPVGVDNEIFETTRFRGRGKSNMTYYVEYASPAGYKHLPLRLNETYRIVDAKGNIVFEGIKSFTLFDVLHSILNEISYHGEPANRRKMFKELMDSFDKEEREEANNIENLQDELDRSVQDENYEKAAKIRDRIEQLKKAPSEDI